MIEKSSRKTALWFLLVLHVLSSVGAVNVLLLSVHVGANPLYGYYAASPVLDVAVEHIRRDFPRSLANISHTAIYLPGYDLCPDGGDHTADFFADYYFTNRETLRAVGNYLVLSEPDCTNQALVMADFARELDLTLLVSAAGDSNLANRRRFPTTSAIAPLSGSDVINSVAAVLKRFSWRTLTLICDSMSQLPGLSNFFYAKCVEIRNFLARNGYTWYGVDFDSARDRAFRSYIYSTKDNCRIYLILTTPQFLHLLLVEASSFGMTSGDYVFISVQPTKRPGVQAITWRGNGTHKEDEMAFEAFQSLLVITGDVPVWSDIQNLTDEFSRVAKAQYNYSYEDEENDMQVNIYESTMMFGQIFDENYPAVISMPKRQFIEQFNNRGFNFAERNFSTDGRGSKVSPVVIQRFSLLTEQMEKAMLFNTVSLEFYDVNPDMWYWTGRNDSPPDMPPCGFHGYACEIRNGTGIVAGVLGACFVMICLAAGIALHCFMERRKEQLRLCWLVDQSTVMLDNSTEFTDSADTVSTFLGQKGRFHGEEIFALSVETSETLTVLTFRKQKKLLTILRQLNHLEHSNVAKFKGITIGLADITLLSEYGERGTLRALLDDGSQVALDSTVRFSLCWDILEAVEYLHKSPLLCHGNLTSLTCIVDARFRAKVAETGYTRILGYLSLERRQTQDPDAIVELIWKPQEVLAVRSNSTAALALANRPGSDLYALGVIFHEILTGRRPLDVDFDSPVSVAATVRQLECYSGLFICQEDEEHFPDGMLDMLRVCLGDEGRRPGARQLRTVFQGIRRRFTDVIGHILRRIENHAADLGDVVAERTAALQVEMAKADNLLQEMLPLEIVRLLREKQAVPSQLFESVTLMFSDMPAFANITANCDPLQIIDFLNATYTLIDGVLPEFDVYKVETINDSYIVASGLPRVNGTQHVFEICRLALSLRKVTKIIKDPTNETSTVLLRTGIHSGPCVAGVIGSRMPRYCLFGDTMNTASRMESHSEAGKIHISTTTRNLVVKSPNFKTESRGQLEIKGKGRMETFWLTEQFA